MRIKLIFAITFSVFAFSKSNAQYSSQNISMLGHWYNPLQAAEPGYGIKYNGCWAWVDTADNMKEYAIIGSSSGTHIIDISDPTNPIERDYVPGRRNMCIWREYKTYGKYLYAISDDSSPNSFQIMDLSYLPDSVHVIHDDVTIFERSHTLFVDGDKLYCGSVTYPGTGGHYSMIVYSLADPANPTLLRALNSDYSNINHVHDMYVRNDTVYASCGYQGLYMYKYNTGSNTFSLINSLTSYPGQGYNHSSYLTPNGRILAFCDEVPANMPVKLLDVSDMQNMSVESTFKSNEGATPHNPYMIGNNHLLVSYYQDGLQIFDISNPAAPVRTGFFDSDTLAGVNTNFTGFTPYHGNWGAYVDLPSGNIVINDMQNGLFVLNASLALSVNENQANSGISTAFIYPNPTSDNVSLSLMMKATDELVIELFDLMGRKIVSEREKVLIGNSSKTINLINVSEGIYVLKITGKEINYSQKLIKK
ncbi:MAG: choice-of-anchor B family protein [Bacteroidia bacterium]|nr:choice-of-anchor B family protein [Bacteroidia bacterium]